MEGAEALLELAAGDDVEVVLGGQALEGRDASTAGVAGDELVESRLIGEEVDFGLAERSVERLLVLGRCEVEEGPGHGGDRDPSDRLLLVGRDERLGEEEA